MSCLIASDNTCLLVAAIYCEEVYNPLRLHSEQITNLAFVADELINENHRSSNYRYAHLEQEQHFHIDYSKFVGSDNKIDQWAVKEYCVDLLDKYTLVEKLKIIDFLEYQSCEHPQFKDSIAYKYIYDARTKLISQLEGYDKASWGIE